MTQTFDRTSRQPAAARTTSTEASAPAWRTVPGARLSAVVLGTVVLVTAIAPLATDMYVPAFPLVGRDLQASTSQVQLTLTTFFVGMALGQLAGGPVSDRIGRRRPLLVSLSVLVAASAACAASPDITAMMSARFVQGFAGGWAMVIARSIVVDLTSGARLVRAMNVIAGAAGVAAVAAVAVAVVRGRHRGVLASGGLGRLESRAIGDEAPHEPAQTPRRA